MPLTPFPSVRLSLRQRTFWSIMEWNLFFSFLPAQIPAPAVFLLDGNYEHFYYLTNDHHGEVLLRLCCTEKLLH